MNLKKYSSSAFLILFLGFYTLLLTGCFPEGDLTSSELDIVVTDYDDNYFNRANPSSYFMPDTIGVIGEGDSQLTREAQSFILQQISSNLSSLGWERKLTIEEDNLPDVVVTASALVLTTQVSECVPWYGWWGDFGPWYPGWGWDPTWCYPTYSYSFETGTLAIDMIDPEDVVDQEFNRVWNAGIIGLVRNSQSGNEESVRTNIEQAFEQSSYLAR